MVYAPGGYNFMDYIKFGVPLQIVCGVFTVAIVQTLDSWWVYTLVLAILSPICVVVFFFACKPGGAGHVDEEAAAKSVALLDDGSEPAPIALAVGEQTMGAKLGRDEGDLRAVGPEGHRAEGPAPAALLLLSGETAPHRTSSDIVYSGSA